MWYVKNDDVIVFMRDSESAVDPEILAKYFPQSYTQGDCGGDQCIEANEPYILLSGECAEMDDRRAEANYMRAWSRRNTFRRMFPLNRRRKVSLIRLILNSERTQVSTYESDAKGIPVYDIPNHYRMVSLASQKRIMSLMNKSGYETFISWQSVAHYLGGGVELHLTVSR